MGGEMVTPLVGFGIIKDNGIHLFASAKVEHERVF
jgi:hypothetical protein